MLVCLLIVVLIGAVAMFQSTQGFFNALLMTAFTVCCAGAALGTYEWVSINWLAPLWGPEFSASLALCAIFGIPMLIIRFGTDRWIRRAPLLPLWIDRMGGGLCGVVTSLLTVGIFAHALVNLPWGTSIFGFARVEIPSRDKKEGANDDPVPPKIDAPIRELWLMPDRFAIGTASMLSNGIFSGEKNFFAEHPDVVKAGAWIAAVPAEVNRFAKPGGIKVLGAEPLQFVYRETPGPGGKRGENLTTWEPIEAAPGHTFQMVRFQLNKGAQDKNKSYLFTLRQIRLVGKSASGALEQHHAVALQQNKIEGLNEPIPINRHIKFKKLKWGDWPIVDDVFAPRGDNELKVEVVFELPNGFQPSYLEYKRGARDAVSFTGATPSPTETPPAEPAAAPSETSSASAAPATAPGTVRRYATKKDASFFGDGLPLTLKAYQKQKDPEITAGQMASGHLVGFVDEQDAGKDPEVSKFKVETDKRLLHLNIGYLQSKSTLGKAISFAVDTLQNYTVTDANGTPYTAVGKYAVADVDGRQVVEIQYFAERAGTVGQLGKFSKIKDAHLKGDYELVLLFAVDPGVQVVSFSTGGAASRGEDLREANLIAPE